MPLLEISQARQISTTGGVSSAQSSDPQWRAIVDGAEFLRGTNMAGWSSLRRRELEKA